MELRWFHEPSTLQHEYILLSVSVPLSSRLSWVRGHDRLSWIRLERMDNLSGRLTDQDSRRARFQHTIAPQRDNLINHGDVEIGQIKLGSDAPSLVDLAHFVVIIMKKCQTTHSYGTIAGGFRDR